MIEFPIQDVLDEEESYVRLCEMLRPDGFICPNGHALPEEQAPHERKRAPVVNYRCRECGAVYNLFTGTIWSGSHYDCRIILLLMRGFIKGVPTQELATEMGLDYKTVLKWRHRVQAEGMVPSAQESPPDDAEEGDEMFQNAGEKGDPHDDPDDPPRPRSNPQRGRGTAASDRPVIVGVVGRESGQVQITVTTDTQNATLVPIYANQVDEETTFYSDDAYHFQHLADDVDDLHTVAHGQDEYALDCDDDGHHEVHNNTIESVWSSLRTFLRRFRGVHKRYLPGYVAMFEWAYNLDAVSSDFFRTLCFPDFSALPT